MHMGLGKSHQRNMIQFYEYNVVNSPAGYQESWGASEDAARLVKSILIPSEEKALL